MDNQKFWQKNGWADLACGLLTVLVFAVIAAALMQYVFIEKNYTITDADYYAAQTAAWFIGLPQLAVYVIWRFAIDNSLKRSRPSYKTPLLGVVAFLVGLVSAGAILGITFVNAGDLLVLSSLGSLGAGLLVCAAVETIGVLLAKSIFTPVRKIL